VRVKKNEVPSNRKYASETAAQTSGKLHTLEISKTSADMNF